MKKKWKMSSQYPNYYCQIPFTHLGSLLLVTFIFVFCIPFLIEGLLHNKTGRKTHYETTDRMEDCDRRVRRITTHNLTQWLETIDFRYQFLNSCPFLNIMGTYLSLYFFSYDNHKPAQIVQLKVSHKSGICKIL